MYSNIDYSNHPMKGWVTYVVQIVFVILKLCGVINWSWWWVFAPLLFNAGIVVIGVIVVGIIAICGKKNKK